MTTRTEIASRCADEIMALSEDGFDFDKETLEHLIIVYMLELEQVTFDKFMADLGKAFKERAEGGRG